MAPSYGHCTTLVPNFRLSQYATPNFVIVALLVLQSKYYNDDLQAFTRTVVFSQILSNT